MRIGSIEKIITPNLILRPYTLRDAEELRSAVIETLDSLLPWMPWAHLEPQTLDEKKELIGSFIESRKNNEDFVFGIFTKDGTLAGSTGLHPRVGPNKIETGYWIRKKFQGKGIATEAAYAMTKTAIEYGDVEQVVIRCDPENHKSARIPEKLGYTFEGEKFSEMFNKMHFYFTLDISDFAEIIKFEPCSFEFIMNTNTRDGIQD